VDFSAVTASESFILTIVAIVKILQSFMFLGILYYSYSFCMKVILQNGFFNYFLRVAKEEYDFDTDKYNHGLNSSKKKPL